MQRDFNQHWASKKVVANVWRELHALFASIMVLGPSRLVVQIARVLNGHLVTFLGVFRAIALFDSLLGDTHCASQTGVR